MFQVKKNKLSEFGAVDKTINHKADEPFGVNDYSHIFLDVGKRGSGKTTVCLNLLKTHYKKFFDKIYLFSSTGKRDPKMKKLIDELERTGQFYEEVDNDKIDQVLQEIEENNELIKEEDDRKARNLIIFDDMIHALDKTTTKNSSFNKLITGNRHYKCCLWVISQRYNMLSTLLRSNADLIAMFKTDNKGELKTLETDININQKLFNDAYNFCCNEPNSFMLINMQMGKPIIYKKFDRLLVD